MLWSANSAEWDGISLSCPTQGAVLGYVLRDMITSHHKELW